MKLGLEYTLRRTMIFTGWTAPLWLTRFPHGLQANQTIPLTNTVLICTLTTTTTEKENGIITFVMQSTMLFVRNENKVSAPLFKSLLVGNEEVVLIMTSIITLYQVEKYSSHYKTSINVLESRSDVILTLNRIIAK